MQFFLARSKVDHKCSGWDAILPFGVYLPYIIRYPIALYERL